MRERAYVEKNMKQQTDPYGKAMKNREEVNKRICMSRKRKFGQHESAPRSSNSNLLSALQTSRVLNILAYAQLKHELIVL